ncbi:MAG: FtsX-like permease family protein [Candidatus Marinimicrobia bacterium]|nr:FtsX-like permease family protein [Candidatus Neomarinimicrobiota bacterium]
MAKLLGAGEGDVITIRWRDAYGTYDAADVEISKVMSVENFKVDLGILWLPLAALQEMTGMPGEATYVTVMQGEPLLDTASPWVRKDIMDMLEDMLAVVEAKQSSAAIIYALLLALSALGIFNSQVLAIFQRRKEIGTLMALGMSRQRVVGLFTLEGGIHSVLALILAIIYGAPLLYLTASRGLPLPMDYSDAGFLIGERLFPVYGPRLVAGTTLLVTMIVTIVSYMPSRKIAKMEPTAALRGK